jgi:hypothetical protein
MKTLILLSLLMVGCNVVSQEQSQYIEPKVIGVCMVSESIYEYNCNVNKDTLIIEIVENIPSYLNRQKSIIKPQK